MGGSSVAVLSDSAVVLVGGSPARSRVGSFPYHATRPIHLCSFRRGDQCRIVHHHSSARPTLNIIIRLTKRLVPFARFRSLL